MKVHRRPEVVAISMDEWAGVHSRVRFEVGIGEHLHEVDSSGQPACSIREVEHRPSPSSFTSEPGSRRRTCSLSKEVGEQHSELVLTLLRQASVFPMAEATDLGYLA
jgi:hypothetical protein